MIESKTELQHYS